MKVNFLTAKWQNLLFFNYVIDPEILKPYLPRGTELDYFQGETYVSIVAFNFNKLKLLGFVPGLPYSFEEVNLRFYIRRGDKRAVAFIKEFVPSKLIAWTAKTFYNEPYIALPMSSKLESGSDNRIYSHSWGKQFEYNLSIKTVKTWQVMETDSREEFIMEHYWGYTPQEDGSTIEYAVKHPRWQYADGIDYQLSDNISALYGSEFVKTLSAKPDTVFVAKGSDVTVSFPSRIKV